MSSLLNTSNDVLNVFLLIQLQLLSFAFQSFASQNLKANVTRCKHSGAFRNPFTMSGTYLTFRAEDSVDARRYFHANVYEPHPSSVIPVKWIPWLRPVGVKKCKLNNVHHWFRHSHRPSNQPNQPLSRHNVFCSEWEIDMTQNDGATKLQ